MSASLLAIILVLLAVLAVATGAAAVVGWRLVGRRISRQTRLALAEQMATSAPHQAVAAWRRSLDEAVELTRRTVEGGRRAGAALADLQSLVHQLQRAVAGLDRELALLAVEPDPAIVDRALRTDVGLRAERAMRVAGQLRRAVGESIASGNAETIDDLASSAELSTTALSAALEELRRPR